MGMYTELILGAKLKPKTAEKIIGTLRFMTESINDPEYPTYWPFPKDNARYRWMLRTGSHYFGVSHGDEPFLKFDSIDNQWIISTRSNLKNYNNEIETFLTWLKPHIEQGSGTRNFYAIVCYEEQAEPTIYYLNEQDQT